MIESVRPFGRYVATELEPKCGHYVATERSVATGNASHRTRARKGSLRSDQTRVPLGRYVAIELEPKLGRYVATKRPVRSDRARAKARSLQRGRRVDSIDGSPLVKNKETLDSFQSALEGQSQFGIYQIDDDTLSELEQQVNFVDTQTLKNKYPIPNPDSFTQNYDATVGSCRGRAKFRLNQAFTGNSKLATDLNGKIDILYSELMRKFDALSEHIKRLDGQVAEDATAIKIEETGETPKEKELPNTEEAAIDLEEEEEELEEDEEIDRQERTNVDRHSTVNID
ncbi:hypothetical protein DY000_02023964 [Brassica cretica]|uniref:Uncharacterized protein n=1 Tax=Brassica cretica TaxID=69181 RepID=A0ABQ7EFU0_BRACR|nr:hypothetical protein DY000_02023964 [Brassica cretica]